MLEVLNQIFQNRRLPDFGVFTQITKILYLGKTIASMYAKLTDYEKINSAHLCFITTFTGFGLTTKKLEK